MCMKEEHELCEPDGEPCGCVYVEETPCSGIRCVWPNNAPERYMEIRARPCCDVSCCAWAVRRAKAEFKKSKKGLEEHPDDPLYRLYYERVKCKLDFEATRHSLCEMRREFSISPDDQSKDGKSKKRRPKAGHYLGGRLKRTPSSPELSRHGRSSSRTRQEDERRTQSEEHHGTPRKKEEKREGGKDISKAQRREGGNNVSRKQKPKSSGKQPVKFAPR